VKRQDLLIRAVSKLQATIPDLHLLLGGDGPERQKLVDLTRQLGLIPRVHFLGYQPFPEQYLSIMDVFALTSRSEGFPVSLLEAWVAGVAVVCSAVGGIPDIVTPECDGLLFSPEDEAMFVSSLARLIADNGLRERLAAAGKRTVRERYSLERMASQYESRYRSLLAGHGGVG
jgi:glycosyltransferase involved in cell wall biosynthesis